MRGGRRKKEQRIAKYVEAEQRKKIRSVTQNSKV